SDNIQVSYDGTALPDFGDDPLTVTNNSSQNFVYTYNPTGGNNADYTVTTNQVVINFNTQLNSEIIPAVSNFSVTANNNSVAVTSILGITKNTVTLGLASSISDSYTVTYTPGTSSLSNLQDSRNNPLPTFTVDSGTSPDSNLINSTYTNSINTNNVISSITTDFVQDQTPALALTSSNNILIAWSSDAPPLAPISAVVNPDNSSQIYINFFVSNSNEVLGGSPSPQQFQVFVNGNPNTVTNIGDPAVGTITLNLASPINAGETVTVSYELNNVSADNLYLTDVTDTTLWIPAFENVTVTNNSGSTSQPLAAVATLTTYQGNIATTLTLTFAQNVDGSSLDLSQFFIYKNGNLITVEPNYATSQNLLSLILGEPVRQGDLISVLYTPNGNQEGGLKDSNGVPLNGFEVQQVITTPTVASTVIKTTTNASDAKLESIPGTGDGIDFDPAAIEFNGQNIVAWVHVDSGDLNNQTVPGQIYSEEDTAQINQALSASDIYYSIYDPTTDQWSLATAIASSQGQDQKVTLGIGPNNQLMAAWLNTQTASNGEINTSIYLSSFDGTTTTWSTPQTLLSDISPDAFTELSISSINGQPAIFWTESQPSSYSNLVFAGNPLVYLRLGELSGTTAFNVGQLGSTANGIYQGVGNFTLNEVGALDDTANNSGDPNPAVLFSNGGGVTLDAAIPMSAQGFSVEFWFKVPTLPSQSLNLLSMLPETGTTPIFYLALNGSTLTFDLGGTVNTQATNIEDNTWNYLVGSYDSTKQALSLYLNGTLLGTPTTVATNTLPPAGRLTLAGGSGSVYLDEVAFYGAPLSQANSSSLNLTADNFMSVSGGQIIDQSFSVNQISDRYQAQYNEPVPSGPEAHYSVWNPISKSWQTSSQIDPIAEIVPTVLSDANNPIWDIVSPTTAQDNTNIFPNGNPDTIFQIAVTLSSNYQSREIVGISVTNNNQTWSVGQDSSGNFLGGNQLGVILGGANGQLDFAAGATLLNTNNPLLNTGNPAPFPFLHRMMSGTETLTLFMDAGNATPPTSANIQVFFEEGPSLSFNNSTPLPNQGGPVSANSADDLGTKVLGIATITEANDSSLSLIDSGFVINTDNTAIAQVLASGFNGKNLAYVAVG
ncbi:hypothetical protein IQ225_00415, partial [Synechocystis salina LEGE 06155]|nr:hypothetical protein [Synechocystis salina LEGE 06155]